MLQEEFANCLGIRIETVVLNQPDHILCIVHNPSSVSVFRKGSDHSTGWIS